MRQLLQSFDNAVCHNNVCLVQSEKDFSDIPFVNYCVPNYNMGMNDMPRKSKQEYTCKKCQPLLDN